MIFGGWPNQVLTSISFGFRVICVYAFHLQVFTKFCVSFAYIYLIWFCVPLTQHPMTLYVTNLWIFSSNTQTNVICQFKISFSNFIVQRRDCSMLRFFPSVYRHNIVITIDVCWCCSVPQKKLVVILMCMFCCLNQFLVCLL